LPLCRTRIEKKEQREKVYRDGAAFFFLKEKEPKRTSARFGSLAASQAGAAATGNCLAGNGSFS